MSKYIKLEDAIDVASKECHEFRGIFSRIEEGMNAVPLIEVSEDCNTCRFKDYKPGEEPCIYCFVNDSKWKSKTEQSSIEVSEDCISREYLLSKVYDMDNDNLVVDLKDIENAPSVVPCCDNEKSNKFQQELQQAEVTTEQSSMVGAWVESEIPNELYVCSECGGACWAYDWERNIVKSRYCPNCGAKMKGTEE